MTKTKFASALLFFSATIISTPISADVITFNSTTTAGNAAARSDWLSAIGVAAPEFSIDFEAGFAAGQNVHGLALFPAGVLLNDTGPGTPSMIIRSGAGEIGGSNPVGSFSVTQDEQAFLEINFSANPVDYVGFMDIDHTGTSGIITFVDDTSRSFSLDSTAGSGNSAEFFGIFRNDQPKIRKIEMNASGDGRWGLDHIEFGGISNVPEPGSTFGILVLASVILSRARLRR